MKQNSPNLTKLGRIQINSICRINKTAHKSSIIGNLMHKSHATMRELWNQGTKHDATLYAEVNSASYPQRDKK